MINNGFTFGKIIAKSFPEALSTVQDKLKECGFGVIATIDFQAAFKEKIGKETLRSISLGACNPALAWKVYQADESLAALLPCHVVVQEQKDNSTKVTMVEPSQMFSTFMMGKHPELKEVADDASTRLHKAMDLI